MYYFMYNIYNFNKQKGQDLIWNARKEGVVRMLVIFAYPYHLQRSACFSPSEES